MSVIEHRTRVELDADALIEQRHEIQALPCAHHNGPADVACQSGQLRRNAPNGYLAELVCDECGETIGPARSVGPWPK